MKHKHYEQIVEWANGKEIEYFDAGVWRTTNDPVWDHDTQYRVKPKPLVKKWRWVLENKKAKTLTVSNYHYSEDDNHVNDDYTKIQKIDSTMIEVQED